MEGDGSEHSFGLNEDDSEQMEMSDAYGELSDDNTD